MVYCEQCGAANDIMNQQCHRCGHQFVPFEEVQIQQLEPVFAHAAPAAQAATAETETAASIGAGLELPEWLQRAAAMTPEAPVAAPIRQQEVFHASEPARAEVAPPPPLHRPVQPPIAPPSAAAAPTAGSTMPEWLRTGQPPVLKQASAADSTDTTSFISEGDLPEWIRQIGAADTAKRAEEERLAAERASIADAIPSSKPLLPGEAPAVGAASNPWLTRKESVNASSAWTSAPPAAKPQPTPVVANPDDERPEVVQVIPDVSAPAAKGKTKLAMPSVKVPSMSKPAMPKFSMPKPASGDANPMMRYVLMGAIVLLVIVLLAMVVL